MIQKAFIESIVDKYSYKVRIPRYNKSATSTFATDSPVAYVCCLPGMIPAYAVGDVVYVAFENEEVNQPVILGQLYRDNITADSYTDVEANDLTVVSKSILADKVSIQGSSLKSDFISGLNGNIQNQIDILDKKIDKVQQ